MQKYRKGTNWKKYRKGTNWSPLVITVFFKWGNMKLGGGGQWGEIDLRKVKVKTVG